MLLYLLSCIFVLSQLNGAQSLRNEQNDIPTNTDILMPPECAASGKSYCFHKGEHYDTLMGYAVDVVNDLTDIIVKEFSEREGPPCGDINCPAVCYTDSRIYYINDEQDKVRLVPQITGEFDQAYEVTECKYPGPINRTTRYFDGIRFGSNGYYCENSYTPLELYVFREDLQSLEKVKVKGGIPTCCTCRYRGNQ